MIEKIIKINLIDEDIEKLNSAMEILQYIIDELSPGDVFEDENGTTLFSYWDLCSIVDTIDDLIKLV